MSENTEPDLVLDNGTQVFMQPEQPKVPPPQINRTAIKRHALKVSRETRNGKFERVSKDFIDAAIAHIESEFRSMRADVQNTPYPQVVAVEQFLTGEGKKKLAEAFNIWVGNQIFRRINSIRTGKTL